MSTAPAAQEPRMSALLQRLLVDAGVAAEICGMSLRAFHERCKSDPTLAKAAVSLSTRCVRYRVRDLEAWVDSLPSLEDRVEPEHLRLARDARLSRRRGEASS